MIIDKTWISKSDPANEGPFKVIRKTQGGSYELQDLDGIHQKIYYLYQIMIYLKNNLMK